MRSWAKQSAAWTIAAVVCAGAAASRGVAEDPLEIRAEVLRLAPEEEGGASPVITAIAMRPQGDVLTAAGDDHLIRVIDLQHWEEVQTLTQHDDWVRTLDFTPDGRTLASAGNDGQIAFWDVEDDFRLQQSLRGAPAIACAEFSPQGGMLAAVGFDPQLFLMQPGAARRPSLPCGCNDMRVVRFSPSMRVVVAAGRHGRVHLFEPQSGQTAGEFELHRDRIRDMRFLPGTETLVTVSEDRTVVVFDTLTEKVLHTIPVEGGKLFAVTPLDSTRVAVGGADNEICVIDVARGGIVGRLRGHTGSIAVLTAGEEYLYSGSFDTTLRRWSLAHVLQVPRAAERTTDSPMPQR